MTNSPFDFHAIVVLPAAGGGGIRDRSMRKVLSKGSVARADNQPELLNRVVATLDHPAPVDLAALRFCGQTGQLPCGWIAAADPVYLEPGMDNLRLHAMLAEDVSAQETGQIFDHLQAVLGEHDRIRFFSHEICGYVGGESPFITSDASPEVVSRRGAAALTALRQQVGSHDRLSSEVQMALHEHAVNQRRADIGKAEINSLWFWGGAPATEKTVRRLPRLYASDPLFKGYWKSCSGFIAKDNYGLADCMEFASSGIVVIVPRADQNNHLALDQQDEYLVTLLSALKHGDLHRLTLLFRDGIDVRLDRRDLVRFWRSESSLLSRAAADA